MGRESLHRRIADLARPYDWQRPLDRQARVISFVATVCTGRNLRQDRLDTVWSPLGTDYLHTGEVHEKNGM